MPYRYEFGVDFSFLIQVLLIARCYLYLKKQFNFRDETILLLLVFVLSLFLSRQSKYIVSDMLLLCLQELQADSNTKRFSWYDTISSLDCIQYQLLHMNVV